MYKKALSQSEWILFFFFDVFRLINRGTSGTSVYCIPLDSRRCVIFRIVFKLVFSSFSHIMQTGVFGKICTLSWILIGRFNPLNWYRQNLFWTTTKMRSSFYRTVAAAKIFGNEFWLLREAFLQELTALNTFSCI